MGVFDTASGPQVRLLGTPITYQPVADGAALIEGIKAIVVPEALEKLLGASFVAANDGMQFGVLAGDVPQPADGDTVNVLGGPFAGSYTVQGEPKPTNARTIWLLNVAP